MSYVAKPWFGQPRPLDDPYIREIQIIKKMMILGEK